MFFLMLFQQKKKQKYKVIKSTYNQLRKEVIIEKCRLIEYYNVILSGLVFAIKIHIIKCIYTKKQTLL